MCWLSHQQAQSADAHAHHGTAPNPARRPRQTSQVRQPQARSRSTRAASTKQPAAAAADLVGTVISAMGKAISSQNPSNSEVDALAVTVGEMLCGYLERYSRRA